MHIIHHKKLTMPNTPKRTVFWLGFSQANNRYTISTCPCWCFLKPTFTTTISFTFFITT